MSLDRVKKILVEGLYGGIDPHIGFMEFAWADTLDEQIEDLYAQAKSHLERININTKNMTMNKTARRVSVVTEQENAQDISDIMGTFGMECVNLIFDPKEASQNPQDFYRQLGNVQKID
jgi:hypothetical protein